MPLRRILPRVLLGASLALVPAVVSAQPRSSDLLESWRWTRFTTASGLPSNRVSALHEAADGSIWGLAAGQAMRFDGFHWQTIPNPAESLGRVVQVVGDAGNDVALVAAGQLWIGAPGSMQRVDELANRVMSVVRVFHRRYVVHTAVNTIVVIDNGRVVPFDAPDGLGREQRVFEIWPVGRRGVFLLADRGLYVFDGERWRHVLEVNGARMMLRAVHAATPGEGLVYIQYPIHLSGVWEWKDGTTLRRHDELPRSMVSSLSCGPNGSALVAYQNGEVWYRRDGAWSALVPGSQADVFAETIFARFTASGDLWLGRERGLFLHRRHADRWRYYDSPRGGRWNEVNDLLVTPAGTLWVATGAGIIEHRADGVRVEHELDGRQTLVTGIAEDATGGLWAVSGAGFPGVRRFDGTRWVPFHSGAALDGVFVHRIAKDRSGHLWFLTLNSTNEWQPSIEPNNEGAFKFDGLRFEQWNAARGLVGRVYTMVEQHDGALWFGTNRGLQRWKDGSWRRWDTADHFLANRVFTLVIDRSSRVWFGDQQRGLGYVEADAAHYLTTADGLVSEAVWGLAVGTDGELWIATHGGLSRHEDGTWATFDADTGLRSTQLWPIVATPEHVYVGTSASGVARLSLAEARSPAPQVRVAPVVVTSTSALVRWMANAWWGEQPPDQVRTRVRVDGGPWSPWTTVRERTMTDLAPGSHTFEIQSANQFGRHDGSSTVVRFAIPPPLYRQPVFFVPVAVLAAVVAALGLTLRIKQRRHQAEQAATADALQQAQKMESIGRLAGGVAHDFNNLLTVILGNTDLLKHSLLPGGSGTSELGSIRLAAEQAGRLTRQLLAFARRQPLELQTVPINDVVRGTLGLVGRLLGEAVTIDSRLDPEAGAVHADRSRLEQVFVNLLVNARDAMPAGGHITITTDNVHVSDADARRVPDATAGDHVVVTVTDAGHGMDADTLGHIFEPFFTTKTAGRGTGLGLATSYGTVRQSGGHIRVESQPGAGATFAVFLPRVTAPAVPVASTVATPRAGARETILVAEDQAMLRALVSRVLQQQGYTVIEACDGAEALDLVLGADAPIDLIVTDIVMPNLRGTELARRVRVVHPAMKVLFISGYADDEPIDHLGPGFGFLPKPFSPQVLGERVRALLDG